MIKSVRDNRRNWISAVGAAAFLWLMVYAERAAGDNSIGLVIRGLIETTDAVLEGTVEEVTVTERGVWHHFRVRTVLRGESRGSIAAFFAHGRDVPESVELAVGDTAVVGIVWLSSDRGSFHQGLIDEWVTRGISHPAGIVAPDGVMLLDGRRGQDLIEEINRLTSSATFEAGSEATSHSTLVQLLRSHHAAIRAEALRRLTESKLDWTAADSSAIRDSFRDELRREANHDVVQRFLDLVRTKNIDGCDGTLCQLILERDDSVLVAEGIDAVRRVAGLEALANLVARYPRSAVRSKARILRTLGASRWEGTSLLARQAIETGDTMLVTAGVEALGELGTGEAADLLDEVLENSRSGRIRELSIQALSRHKTPLSRELLRKALNRSQARERRLILRLLSPPGRRTAEIKRR